MATQPWQDYDDLGEEPASGDTFLVRDISDTTADPDGTVKEVTFAELLESVNATLAEVVTNDSAAGVIEAYLITLDGTPDATTAVGFVDGLPALVALNPAQVSAPEIAAGTETALRSYSVADIVALILAHETVGGGGGTGLATELNANTSIVVGAGTDGEHHVLTSDSAITLTLDKDATVGMESAFTPAGAGAVSVAVEAGATYWVPTDDIGGSGATATFTLKGYGYFICIRNTDDVSAEWLFVGASDLAAIISGNLTVGGTLGVTGNTTLSGTLTVTGDATINGGSLFIDEEADDAADVAAKFQLWSKNSTPNTLMGTDDAGNKYKLNGSRVITGVSGSLTYDVHHGNIMVLSGNVTVPNAAADVGGVYTLISDGARTVTFNSLTSAAMAAGDVMTVIVQSTTVAKAVLVEAANLVTFS